MTGWQSVGAALDQWAEFGGADRQGGGGLI
jgi:hypothetical protein